ncbi:3-ketoacyl-CoA thiolase @ Acetyl-CoA acetyltransferase [Microbacterium esteraromaticum]|uniref:Probable acetyl-CoA acetyltransferase n=1 Tax=Microbacterium esteraromaticum TaxID=57043 RepID=A0A1R4K7I2_9MICO|nr:thiolase family protein [Microbacterium esteraromaticum]SJN40246.1 3-ketoacyl-CoA thiolase @ Acetyl-CoA acetyltransferase [Microbacterium esteraromaticum]
MAPAQGKVAIVAGARTAVGRFGGAFKDTAAHELGAAATAEALRRSGIAPERVGEVVIGTIGQVAGDAYISRRIALAAGLDVNTPAFTVNRLCGSGLQAIWSGAQELLWGSTDVVVAGGAENMTRMPFYDFNARFNDRFGHRQLLDGTISMLTDPFTNKHMGTTAENVATRFGVTREEQDAFALESQQRAAADAAHAAFAEEIVTVTSSGRKPVEVSKDEHPRPDTTLETLAGLPAAFAEGGTVTAGNASGINDGAAAAVLMREEDARAEGAPVLATIEAVTTAALEPEIMGYAPTLALKKLFAQTRLTPADISTVELNEAFASQVLAVIRDAELDPARTNPYGGAIALGHPVGATGAILTIRAALTLQRTGGEYAIVTMCIGGGQALAALLKRG